MIGTNRNKVAPILGYWCEVSKKNAISPIAVPDIVPTAVALSEDFQFNTELHSDKLSMLA